VFGFLIFHDEKVEKLEMELIRMKPNIRLAIQYKLLAIDLKAFEWTFGE
jgi:hypothetical protein